MSGEDADPGRVVPVYALTGGRTRSGERNLPYEALVTTAEDVGSLGRLQVEHRRILQIAATTVSLVEIGAHLGVPVGVARVLVTDLADAGYLVVHEAAPTSAGGRPTPEILERLLDGLRAR